MWKHHSRRCSSPPPSLSPPLSLHVSSENVSIYFLTLLLSKMVWPVQRPQRKDELCPAIPSYRMFQRYFTSKNFFYAFFVHHFFIYYLFQKLKTDAGNQTLGPSNRGGALNFFSYYVYVRVREVSGKTSLFYVVWERERQGKVGLTQYSQLHLELNSENCPSRCARPSLLLLPT